MGLRWIGWRGWGVATEAMLWLAPPERKKEKGSVGGVGCMGWHELEGRYGSDVSVRPTREKKRRVWGGTPPCKGR